MTPLPAVRGHEAAACRDGIDSSRHAACASKSNCRHCRRRNSRSLRTVVAPRPAGGEGGCRRGVGRRGRTVGNAAATAARLPRTRHSGNVIKRWQARGQRRRRRGERGDRPHPARGCTRKTGQRRLMQAIGQQWHIANKWNLIWPRECCAACASKRARPAGSPPDPDFRNTNAGGAFQHLVCNRSGRRRMP